MAVAEYTCLNCQHQFPWFRIDEPHPRCPRCGSEQLQKNPWLLGSSRSEDLAEEDYLESLLSV